MDYIELVDFPKCGLLGVFCSDGMWYSTVLNCNRVLFISRRQDMKNV